MGPLTKEQLEAVERLQEALQDVDCLDKLLVLGLATGALFHHLLEDHLPDDYTYSKGYFELLKEFTREIEAARAHVAGEGRPTPSGGEGDTDRVGSAPRYVSPPAKGFH